MNATPLRLSTTGQDTIGYTVLAGRSLNNKQVNVLISNYQRDANYLSEPIPQILEASLALDLPATSPLALSFFGFKPPFLVDDLNPPLNAPEAAVIPPPSVALQSFNYSDNQGYDVTVKNLPWGNKEFVISRFRIDANHNLSLIDETTGANGEVHLTATLPPPSVELLTLRER